MKHIPDVKVKIGRTKSICLAARRGAAITRQLFHDSAGNLSSQCKYTSAGTLVRLCFAERREGMEQAII